MPEELKPVKITWYENGTVKVISDLAWNDFWKVPAYVDYQSFIVK